MIRVLLADDQVLVRAGFRVLLDAEPDIEVVGEADDGEAAVRMARDLLPDVVLMDIRMPGVDGLEATRRIVADERLDRTRIVILTTFDLDEYVFEALRAGASGFLLKDTLPEDLLNAVRVVADGEALLAPKITRRLIEQFVQQPAPTSAEPNPGFEMLTDREREVLELRFGLKDGKDHTLEEVSRYFDVTRERIRQIEAKALRKLRHPSRSRQLRDYLA